MKLCFMYILWHATRKTAHKIKIIYFLLELRMKSGMGLWMQYGYKVPQHLLYMHE